MVSQNTVRGEVAPGAVHSDRGFVSGETVVTPQLPPGSSAYGNFYQPFWRAVIAGSLVAISMFVLSWYLMLGCHVGINDNGVIDLGGGAAVWMWVTAALAFFVGGMMSSAISPGNTSYNWARGLSVWGLAIPLALVIFAAISQNGNLLAGLKLPHGTVAAGTIYGLDGATGAHYGYYWSMFIGVICGLIFSLIGSSTGYAERGELTAAR